ncbi:MAG: monovalent cation/H+ antiporter subunit D family protein [Alphaproteobacteria bacterium]|nr:monovalent cation/H+ antiporter subunit D family protein [Alphaproteobacteria bacterium]
MTALLRPDCLVLASMIIPLVAALVIPVFHNRSNLREGVTLIAAVLLCATVWSLLPGVMAGKPPSYDVVEVLPGVALAFKIEPLGMLFGLIASTLWIVNSVYSIGYMRAHNEPRQTTYYVCFAIALASTMGVAFAKNLFTLFLFYELLTISTYPLVTHNRDSKSMSSGRLYLMLLLGTSMLLFLPAIIATFVLAGTTDFAPGGILAGKAGTTTLIVLLALFAFGIGKAAVMPLHFWLPAAMVAPTPVSALLHAVAVVKAGVFCVAKIVLYVFGLDSLSGSGANVWLVYLATACIVGASLIALSRGNLKARLAYSTVSQLAYVVLGAALATSAGLLGGALQIAMHAVGKITLFFCAGAIYIATHKTEIKQLDGIGRTMPFTMLAFLIGSLSIIGIPPLGGTWSKWYLALAAADAGFLIVVGALMVSSLLNVAYLLSIVGRAFFLPPRPDDDDHGHGNGHGHANGHAEGGIHEAPLACVIPLSLTALGCIVLFFQIDNITALLAPAAAGK